MDDYNDAEQLAGVGGSALRGAGKIANAATRRLRERLLKRRKRKVPLQSEKLHIWLKWL